MAFYFFKTFLSELLPDSLLTWNMSLISDVYSQDSIIKKRKISIMNNINSLPKDLTKIICEYDYSLEGKSYTFIGHRKSVCCLTLLPDERIASGCDFRTIKVWNVTTGKCDITFDAALTDVTCIAALHDGRIVSGSYDKVLKIWNSSTGKCEETLYGHFDKILCVCALPDGSSDCSAERGQRIVSGCRDGSIKIWNLDNYSCDITFYHNHRVSCLAVMKQNKCSTGVAKDDIFPCSSSSYHIVSGSYDGTIKIWDTFGNCLMTFNSIGDKSIKCIAVLLDGRIISVSGKNEFEIWDAQTGKCVFNFVDYECCIKCISVLPDGSIVCGSYGNKLKVLEPYTGNCIREFIGHDDRVLCVDSLPDGRIVSGSYDTTLKLWS
jgi:WD40 repeat protein